MKAQKNYPIDHEVTYNSNICKGEIPISKSLNETTGENPKNKDIENSSDSQNSSSTYRRKWRREARERLNCTEGLGTDINSIGKKRGDTHMDIDRVYQKVKANLNKYVLPPENQPQSQC